MDLAKQPYQPPSLTKFPPKHPLHVTFLEYLSERRVEE
jgi:hypothetical protein